MTLDSDPLPPFAMNFLIWMTLNFTNALFPYRYHMSVRIPAIHDAKFHQRLLRVDRPVILLFLGPIFRGNGFLLGSLIQFGKKAPQIFERRSS